MLVKESISEIDDKLGFLNTFVFFNAGCQHKLSVFFCFVFFTKKVVVPYLPPLVTIYHPVVDKSFYYFS